VKWPEEDWQKNFPSPPEGERVRVRGDSPIDSYTLTPTPLPRRERGVVPSSTQTETVTVRGDSPIASYTLTPAPLPRRERGVVPSSSQTETVKVRGDSPIEIDRC
jgi:hypothetical protein